MPPLPKMRMLAGLMVVGFNPKDVKKAASILWKPVRVIPILCHVPADSTEVVALAVVLAAAGGCKVAGCCVTEISQVVICSMMPSEFLV